MFLGVALILVAGLTVGLLMVAARRGPGYKPRCDCPACNEHFKSSRTP